MNPFNQQREVVKYRHACLSEKLCRPRRNPKFPALIATVKFDAAEGGGCQVQLVLRKGVVSAAVTSEGRQE